MLNFGSKTTPLTAADQADFAATPPRWSRRRPTLRDFIVGNEPNLNRYWLPQFDADGERRRRARVRVAARPDVRRAEGGSPDGRGDRRRARRRAASTTRQGRDTHSPTAFITDMGAAYRASGRTTPIMDALSLHPYEDNSSVAPPTARTRTRRRSRSPTTAKLVAAARPGVRRHGAAGLEAADLLRRVRRRVADPGRRSRRSTPAPSRRRRSRSTRRRRRRTTGRRSSSRSASRTVDGLFLFHAVDETALAGVAVGPLLRRRHAEDEPRARAARDRAGAARRSSRSARGCGSRRRRSVVQNGRRAHAHLRHRLLVRRAALPRRPGSCSSRSAAGRSAAGRRRCRCASRSSPAAYRLRLSARRAGEPRARPSLLRRTLAPG